MIVNVATPYAVATENSHLRGSERPAVADDQLSLEKILAEPGMT